MTTMLAPAYSTPSVYDGPAGRVHHGYSTAPADTPDGALRAWCAKLESGGFIVPHVDQGPWVERWHHPVSGQGYVWQDWDDGIDRGTRLATFEPYRMNHHRPHAVWNPFDYSRIVLIVEYDNPVDQPTTDLIMCPMIPQVQELIDAV